jgi:hypothetical protein
VDKALTAPFKLKRFIVLSTSKTSTELQLAISQINAAHMEIGQFIVEFKGWDEIERILDDYPEVAQDKLSIVTNTQLTFINENLANVTTDLAEIKSAVSNNEFDADISAAKEEIERRDFSLAKQRGEASRRAAFLGPCQSWPHRGRQEPAPARIGPDVGGDPLRERNAQEP